MLRSQHGIGLPLGDPESLSAGRRARLQRDDVALHRRALTLAYLQRDMPPYMPSPHKRPQRIFTQKK